MTEPSTSIEQPPATIPGVDQGMSMPLAIGIAVISLVILAASSYAVVGGMLSAGMTRLLAVVCLLSLAALVYGLIEVTLAVIATTTERRRREREVTERRLGDRARK